jgi:hypothetical protein
MRVLSLESHAAAKAAAGMTEGDAELDWNAYRRASPEWELWDLIATITLAPAVVLMVAKPAI